MKTPKKNPEPRSVGETIGEYFVSEGPKLLFIFIWFLLNAALVGFYYYRYAVMILNGLAYTYLGTALCLARASAAGIMINFGLILFMVLRNFLSWLRASFLADLIPLDKNIVFHRSMAWVIAFYTAVHIISHYFNYNNLYNLYLNLNNINQTDAINLVGQLLNPIYSAGCSPNPPFYPCTNPLTPVYLVMLPSGYTGYAATWVQILMYAASIRYIRGPMFNLFWYVHHLFIILFILLVFHAFHLPGHPGTEPITTFWAYIVIPLFFYAIERTVRIVRGNQDTILLMAVAHPSRVLELQLKKSSFKYIPGQYIFLNCPYIASQEWHPFTISSAPEEDFISIHIRTVGDWTNELWTFMNPNKRLGIVQENITTAPDGSPIFRIDGPFGSASEEIFKFRTVILVAGGIGVTPFGSILKHINYRIRMGQNVLEKVYFYWVSRDKGSFEWFNEVLLALENDNINNFLEICTYLTSQLNVEEIRRVVDGIDQPRDQINGLQSPTYFGRPDWDKIFAEKAEKHRGTTVGVFFCGPSVLSKQLSRYSSKYTSTSTHTIFLYHKENF